MEVHLGHNSPEGFTLRHLWLRASTTGLTTRAAVRNTEAEEDLEGESIEAEGDLRGNIFISTGVIFTLLEVG